MMFFSCCIVMALVAVGPADSGSPGGSGSTSVAVVDVPAVSERYEKTRDLEAAFEQRRVGFTRQRDALRERIKRTGRSLQEEVKPGTKEFEDRRKQFVMLEAELQWFVETEGQKIEEGLAQSLREIYDDIQAVVRDVADERGIDVVLAADRLPNEPARSPMQARQQIVLQKVVYWNPRVDITEEVVVRLNAKYKAQRPASSPGLARPPALEGDEAGGLRSGKTRSSTTP